MGDYIYAISLGGITVTNLTSMEGTDEIRFEDYIHTNTDEIVEEHDSEEDQAQTSIEG
tara:strand:- start:696 stop:869 length:174 start_codon:yes stop_codon:yes gene_type:complete